MRLRHMIDQVAGPRSRRRWIPFGIHRFPCRAPLRSSGPAILRWLAFISVIACAPHVAAAAPSCADDGKPYDPHTLGGRVAQLAAEKLDGRVPGSAGDVTARALVRERFACLGLTPGGNDGTYEQPFV